MAVPTTIADLSATASSNSPAGTDAIGTSLDDYLRAHAAIIKQESEANATTYLPLAGGTLTGTVTGLITEAQGLDTIGNGTGWTVVQTSTTLYFKYNGTNKASLDTSGNLRVTGNVTAYATIS